MWAKQQHIYFTWKDFKITLFTQSYLTYSYYPQINN